MASVPDHPPTVDGMPLPDLLRVASSYKDRGVLERATELFGRALACSMAPFQRARVLREFGELLLEQHEGQRALLALEEVERLCVGGLGPAHPDTVTARCSVARCHVALGQPEAAVTTLRAALGDVGVALSAPVAQYSSLMRSVAVRAAQGESAPGSPSATPSGQGDTAHTPAAAAADPPVTPAAAPPSGLHWSECLVQSDSDEEGDGGEGGSAKPPKWSPLRLAAVTPATTLALSVSAQQFARAGVLFQSPTSAVDSFACVDDARGAACVTALRLLLRAVCGCQGTRQCASPDCFTMGESVCGCVWDALRGWFGEAHPASAEAVAEYGQWCAWHGHFQWALHAHARALDVREELLGDTDPDVLLSCLAVGEAAWLCRQGRVAVSCLTRAATGLSDEFGDGDEDAAVAVWQFGKATAFARGDPAAEQPLAVWSEHHLPAGAFLHLWPAGDVASPAAAADALPVFSAAFVRTRAAFGVRHPYHLSCAWELGLVAAAVVAAPGAPEGDVAFAVSEAVKALSAVVAGVDTGGEGESVDGGGDAGLPRLLLRARALVALAGVHRQAGRADDAAAALTSAVALMDAHRAAPEVTPVLAGALEELSAVTPGGEVGQRERLLRDASALRSLAVAHALVDAGDRLARSGRAKAAATRYREALQVAEQAVGREHPVYSLAAHRLDSCVSPN